MFDFSKIGMKPTYGEDFFPSATEEQIKELEDYCGHTLPENYKTILKKYNGGQPEAKYFDVIDEEFGVPCEWKLYDFYILNNNKESSSNVWWIVEQYPEFLGPNTLPFADDGLQQFYYLKWVDDVPQVWFLAYLDRDYPETYLVMESFDKLLESLYAVD